VRGEFRGCWIDRVDEDAVEAEVGDEGEAVVRRDDDLVGVGRFLTRGIYAGAGVWNDGTEGAQATVELKGDGGDATATVVGDEHGAAGGIDRKVARARAAVGLSVEQGECAGGGIERVSADADAGITLGIGALVYRVEKFTVRVNGEPRGIFGFGGELGGREAAGGGVETRAVNAFAGGLGVRVGAEVDEKFLRGGERAGGGEHGEGERESGAELHEAKGVERANFSRGCFA
jgi:hypothetical protein